MGKANKNGKTNVFMSILHALNFSDFAIELWHELRFLFDRIRGKEYTRADTSYGKFDFVGAFNANGNKGLELTRSINTIEMSQTAGLQQQEKENRTLDEETDNETMLSKQALLGSGTLPAQQSSSQVFYPVQGESSSASHAGQPYYAQQAIPPTIAPAELRVPTAASSGRISPKPRSPRDSTGRYPSFLYEGGNNQGGGGGGGIEQNAYYQQQPSQYTSTLQSPIPQQPQRQPSPVDQSSWATPGAYTVKGFPRSSVMYSSANEGYDERLHPSQQQQQQYQQQQYEQQQQRLQQQPQQQHYQQQHHHQQHQQQNLAESGPARVQEERPRSWEPQAM